MSTHFQKNLKITKRTWPKAMSVKVFVPDSMHSLRQVIARKVTHESRKLKQARPEGQDVDLLLERACYSLISFSF